MKTLKNEGKSLKLRMKSTLKSIVAESRSTTLAVFCEIGLITNILYKEMN